MTAKLYIGNLSYYTTEEELRELFSQAGSVESVALPIDRMSERPRGFGFVEIASPEDARKAIEMFDGTTLRDRQIKVNESRPRQEDRGENRPGGRSHSY